MPPSVADVAAIDATAERLMRHERVVGMTPTLIDDGQVVAIRAYGRDDVEHDLPLEVDTILYGASLVKGVHDEVTGNMAICVERRRSCLVALANDARAERLDAELFRAVLGANAMPWSREYPFVEAR